MGIEFFFRIGKKKHVSKTKERKTTALDRDDILIKQIDEFKVKARQLQEMLQTREGRVHELQTVVHAKEERVQELEQELSRKKSEANYVSEELNRNIQMVIEKMDLFMQSMGERLSTEVQESLDESKSLLTTIDQTMQNMNISVEGMKKDISENIHDENVRNYRNVQMVIVDLEKKMVQKEDHEKDVKSLKTILQCTTWVAVVNFIVLVAYILYQLKVF